MTTADGSLMVTAPIYYSAELSLSTLSLPGGMLQAPTSCCIFLLEPNDTLIVIEMFDMTSLKYFAAKLYI